MQKEDWDRLPKTRKEAKQQGSKFYFTGDACKHGHVAPRKVKGACVECIKEDSKQAYPHRVEYFQAYNKSEAGKAAKRGYYERNTELVKQRATTARKVDPKKRKVNLAVSRKRNAKSRLIDTQMYRRRIRHCTPKWLTVEEWEQIREIYRSAMEMTKLTGEKYTVDHQVPLRSKVVSGLHVPWNLRIMPHADNSRKGNRLEA